MNELLLQSFEGFLRFFPGWPLGHAARFSTLRAKGAFLVSGAVAADGTVTDLLVFSEAGAPCSFLNPFGRPPAVTERSRAVPTRRVGAQWRFETRKGVSYAITESALAYV